jgi:hypothetical protein
VLLWLLVVQGKNYAEPGTDRLKTTYIIKLLSITLETRKKTEETIGI